jgi:hypothetical protein
MADVVYLHVGAPKTGTTYLQERLRINRTTLAEHDVHYPVGLLHDMFGPALDLLDESWGGQREQFRGEWDNLVGRVRRSKGTALVTHEILAGAPSSQVARAMQDFAGTEVHVVYSARDLARQIPAEWQESVKHRNKKQFKRYLNQVMNADRLNPSLWFWRAQGLPDVLGRWSAGLPPERVHLVTVPQRGAPRDELWLRYCRAFSIDPAFAPADDVRSNPSLGIDETAMLRYLNRRLRRAGLDSAAYRTIVRQTLVHDTLAQRKRMRPVTLPPRVRDWAEEVAQEWVEWVQGSGIDVLGDVEDLRPRFPDGDGKWADPDNPRNRRIADAAIDALVAAVVELSERPDPAEGTVAKIGRAARRLRGQ